jgi:hypothetical protein
LPCPPFPLIFKCRLEKGRVGATLERAVHTNGQILSLVDYMKCMRERVPPGGPVADDKRTPGIYSLIPRTHDRGGLCGERQDGASSIDFSGVSICIQISEERYVGRKLSHDTFWTFRPIACDTELDIRPQPSQSNYLVDRLVASEYAREEHTLLR